MCSFIKTFDERRPEPERDSNFVQVHPERAIYAAIHLRGSMTLLLDSVVPKMSCLVMHVAPV